MDVYISLSAHKALGQFKVSSHQLEIKIGRALNNIRVESIFKLCEGELKSGEHSAIGPQFSTTLERSNPPSTKRPNLTQASKTLGTDPYICIQDLMTKPTLFISFHTSLPLLTTSQGVTIEQVEEC